MCRCMLCCQSANLSRVRCVRKVQVAGVRQLQGTLVQAMRWQASHGASGITLPIHGGLAATSPDLLMLRDLASQVLTVLPGLRKDPALLQMLSVARTRSSAMKGSKPTSGKESAVMHASMHMASEMHCCRCMVAWKLQPAQLRACYIG